MSFFTGITTEQVIDAITGIAHDVSVFAPPPANVIAELLSEEAALIEQVLRARDAGATADAIVKGIEVAIKAASDLQEKQELGP